MEASENFQCKAYDLSSILECNLCLNIVCEPISISCGHTFCRCCLVKSLKIHKKKCPTCREVCYVTAENAPENIMIKSLVQKLFPELYQERLKETYKEKEEWSTYYPVFFYNSLIFPGNKLSLHLFEPRYRLMIQRVVNSSRSFAYLPKLDRYDIKTDDIALIAEIKEAEILQDGRCLLDSVITKRMRVKDHYEEVGTQGLHYCSLVPFEDEPILEDQVTACNQLMHQGHILAQYLFQKTDPQVIEAEYGLEPKELKAFSLWLLSICPMATKKKYDLLASTSTFHRLHASVLSLGKFINQAYQSRLFGNNSNGETFYSTSDLGNGNGETPIEPMSFIMRMINRRLVSTEENSSSDEESSSNPPVRDDLSQNENPQVHIESSHEENEGP